MSTWLVKLVPSQPQAAPGRRGAAPVVIWLVHCMIGDGIATNEATAKIVWALFRNLRTHNHRKVRYFLLLGKCGTHQSALSAKNGVEGNVAAASAKDNTYKGVTENAVRLFKYLVPEYFEDFRTSILTWVRKTVVVMWESEAESFQAGQLQAARLRQLYTAHVIPDKLLALTGWVPATGGDALLPTVFVSKDTDNVDAMLQSVELWTEFFVDHCLKPDSHPTLTRFYTFRACVDRILIMRYIEQCHN